MKADQKTDSVKLLRRTTFVLGLVNVHQPISRTNLLPLSPEDSAEDLNEVLSVLEKNGLIRRIPGDQFRTTWKGQNSLWSPGLKKTRDVHRMWQLSDESDKLRNERKGEGEPSQ